MRIKILEVAPTSSHFGNEYTLVGTTGDIVSQEQEHPYERFILENCVYADQDLELAARNGEISRVTCVVLAAYEDA